jgi:hypothetical protein
MFPILNYDQKKISIVSLVMMIVLVIDVSIGNVADIIVKQIVSVWGIVLFVILAAVYAIGQFYILQMAKAKNRQIVSKARSIQTLGRIVTVVQYVLLAIIISVVLQILLLSYYYTGLLAISAAISYGLTVLLMGFLAYRLFSWLKLNRSLAVLLYGLAATMVTVNAIDSIIFFDVILLGKPEKTSPQSEVIFEIGFDPGTPMSYVSLVQSNSYLAYFLLTWGGTIIIMRHNVARLGRIKFWVIVSLPIIYFLGYSLLLYPSVYPPSPVTEAISSNFMVPILLYTYSVTICGILFGIGFISISRFVKAEREIRDYMLMSGLGFILFFNSAQSTVLQAAYPPFGLLNVSFVGLASYLILSGLYNSAISVANDVTLRKSIRKSTAEASKLLDNIGSAQMKKEIEDKVLKVTNSTADSLLQETGIHSSLTIEEIKEYMSEVIEELQTRKS